MMKIPTLIATTMLLSSLLFSQEATTAGIASASDPSPAPVVQPPPSQTRTNPPVAATTHGLIFSTADGSTNLTVHGYAQAQNRMFDSNMNGENVDAFLFRKIRPLFEGTLFNAIDFRFMPDFGQNQPQIQEAYLELKTFRFAKLRVGKFKMPIGLEALRQDRELTFIERSPASDLVPLRYFGAQLSGSVLSDLITYAGGYFNGSNDGANGVFTRWAHSNEGAGRVFLQPFVTTGVSMIRGFGIGLAGSSGSAFGTIPGLKTAAQSTFFKYSSKVVADGTHTRISPQAYYYAGPVGLLGEYVISSQDVLSKTKTGAVTGTMTNEAWQVTGSVMLTGEKNSYAGVVPRNSFEPTQGFRHIGAVELAVRASQVRIDSGAFPLFANAKTAPQQAMEYGIGVNWLLNRFVKVSTDYHHTKFTMATSSVSPLSDENVVLSQIQLAF